MRIDAMTCTRGTPGPVFARTTVAEYESKARGVTDWWAARGFVVEAWVESAAVTFYNGDVRFRLAVRSTLVNGLPPGCAAIRLDGGRLPRRGAVTSYAAIRPPRRRDRFRDSLKDSLKDSGGASRPVSIPATIARIAAAHGVGPRDLLGRTRLSHIVDARRDLYHALRVSGLSLTQIGAAVGRDHTTVMTGLKRREELRARRGLADPDIFHEHRMEESR